MKKLSLILSFSLILGLASCHREEVGWLSISSTPTGADVYLDDSLTGAKTDCILDNLPAGEHIIKLTLSGYSNRDTTVSILPEKGETLSVIFNASEGSLKWRYRVGFYIKSSPAIGSDGAVYIGSLESDGSGGLYAINPDGVLRWKYLTGGDVSQTPSIGYRGTIYVPSEEYPNNNLYAVNTNGSLKWKYKEGGSTPAVDDGIIYASYWGNTLHAIESDGSIKWELNTGLWRDCSSPVINSDGIIYLVTYNSFWGYSYLSAYDTDDTLADSLRFIWDYEIRNNISASPAIGDDGTIYIGADDPYNVEGALYAINPDSTLKWKYETGTSVTSSVAIGQDGSLYFGSDGFYAIKPDGSLKWKFKTDGAVVQSSPAIGSDGIIYFGTYDGVVYAVGSEGVLKWKYQTGDRVVCSPAIGNDCTVYIGSADGFLYAISCSSKGLANFPWPKYRHDNQNTGNAAWPIR